MVLRCRAYVAGPGLIFRAKEEIFPVARPLKKIIGACYAGSKVCFLAALKDYNMNFSLLRIYRGYRDMSTNDFGFGTGP